ncbi:hypothetical protein [Natrarchaeobius chitinivorans]|uniref:Sulfatase n=1 Tax=Natrarchaeobius chitinivorans TaxID=1679083 RepID=A0A3N6P341_NATCH|nr:hypothetical protein [Natrarchaeobius chitinivorans]RQG92059.1 hypothetical protein EA473_17520 [Natrarchaeobius chitinivorans]
MFHHLHRAKEVLEERGAVDLAKTSLRYAPIELNNIIYNLRSDDPTNVMDEEWDVLILLDACRYDMFPDSTRWDGELESRISLGSTSEEFLQRNFADGTHHDTVYVNANPHLCRLGFDADVFHAVIDLLSETKPIFPELDCDIETVHPETVVEATREAIETFENKRFIIHFLQPHHPFIGEAGRELAETGQITHDKDIWTALREGDITDHELVWEAYRENLEIVLSSLEPLIDELTGKIVLSSDHGNLVGERPGPIPVGPAYGHPYGVYCDELLEVPWYVIEKSPRPEIRAEPPLEQERADEDDIEQRLEALGYK